MATISNVATNGRSLNGILSLTDGFATLESGNLDCNDINSSSINTTTLSTNNLTCKGTFLSNTNGTYLIPTATTSITGSLISYNNTNGNGETDFTNYGSTYNTLLQGFRFWNVNSTQTLTNLAIIDNTQTYFKSQLVGCTAETPLNNTSIVNKSYVDNNFVNFTSDQTITGTKRFNTIFTGDHSYRDVGSPFTNRLQSYLSGTSFVFTPIFNSNSYRFYTRDGASTETFPLTINSASTTITNSLITNNLTADNIIGTQNIYTTNTGGIINIGTGQTTGVINIGSLTSNIINNSINTLNAQHTFNNSTPLCSVATPTANNHLTRKDYVDNNFMFKTGTVTESINGIKTFTNRVNFNNSLCFVATGNSEFSGANGYFQINCGMGSGSYNPASQNGTIGIIGLKDQTNDKFLLTLYGNIHASVKLNFTEGVSMGFGGSTQQGNTSVTCDGTNVIIKPSIKFSLDNTIQNSAFTGAGTLNGSYNLSNITIDTNGKITSLSSGLTTTNSFTGVNTFTNNTNFSSSITLTDIANFSTVTIQQNSAVLNIENPSLGSTIRLKTRPSVGAVQNSLTLNTASCDILSPTLNLTGASPSSILSPNNLNGTINLFNNLTTGGTININSSTGSNIINGNVTITNNLISNGQATFNNNTPICTVSTPTAINHLVRKDYVDNNFVDKTSTQSISGDKTFEYYLKTKQGLWIYDAMYPYTNFMELSLLGTAMQIVPSFDSNSYQIYTKDAGNYYIPITINNNNTTFDHQLICNNGATFNNNLPTSTINASSSNQFTIRGFCDATYQTITSMASYLTTSAAALLYQEKIVGSIIQMAVATLPSGYLACDGGSYSSATYSSLSTVLNFTYGGSAPSGLFKTPDFRGMFLRGAGTNGIDSTYVSANYGSLQTDGIRAHTHDILFGYLPTVSGGGGQNAYNSTSPNYNNPGTGGGRSTGITSTNANPYPDTRPANFCVFYCIKY